MNLKKDRAEMNLKRTFFFFLEGGFLNRWQFGEGLEVQGAGNVQLAVSAQERREEVLSCIPSST